MVKIKSRIMGVVLAACLLLSGCAVGTSDYTINQTVSDGNGAVSSTSTALDDNSDLIKQEFQGALERLTDAKSLLLSNITEAQNIISSEQTGVELSAQTEKRSLFCLRRIIRGMHPFIMCQPKAVTL